MSATALSTHSVPRYYRILLVFESASSLPLFFQIPLENRRHLGARCWVSWSDGEHRRAADQAFTRRLPSGLARSNAWLICQLPLLREKTLENGSHLSSRRMCLWG